MCQAKKPKITAAAPAERPKAQFTTPDQLAGRNESAGVNAERAGRNALRIDRGSDPTMAGITPTENDQVRDYPAEDAAALADAQAAAASNAEGRKAKEKKKFNRLSRIGQSGVSIAIRNAVSGEKNTSKNIIY